MRTHPYTLLGLCIIPMVVVEAGITTATQLACSRPGALVYSYGVPFAICAKEV